MLLTIFTCCCTSPSYTWPVRAHGMNARDKHSMHYICMYLLLFLPPASSEMHVCNSFFFHLFYSVCLLHNYYNRCMHEYTYAFKYLYISICICVRFCVLEFLICLHLRITKTCIVKLCSVRTQCNRT